MSIGSRAGTASALGGRSPLCHFRPGTSRSEGAVDRPARRSPSSGIPELRLPPHRFRMTPHKFGGSRERSRLAPASGSAAHVHPPGALGPLGPVPARVECDLGPQLLLSERVSATTLRPLP